MTKAKRARSFEKSAENTVNTSEGFVAHRDLVDHSSRLKRNFYQVGGKVWCLVGNGLSNQTFIDAPEGIIAIDTGESNEEMLAAMAELRQQTTNRSSLCCIHIFITLRELQAVLDAFPNQK